MENKRDVGKLIKERLANAEMPPSDALWSKIENSLDNKRKRGGGYLWFLLGTIGLLGLLILYYSTLNDEISGASNPSTIKETAVPAMRKDKNEYLNETIILARDSVPNKTPEQSSISKQENENNTDKINDYSNKEIDKGNYDSIEPSEQASKKSSKKVRSMDNADSVSEKNKGNKKSNEKQAKPSPLKNTKDIDHGDSTPNNKISIETSPSEGSVKRSNDSPSDSDHERNEIIDSLPKKSNPLKERKVLKDSTITVEEEPNILKNYHLFPFVNGTYYVSLRNASTIDERLADNKKSPELRTSYGIYLIFKADNWGLRFGVAHASLQKNTFDVPIASGQSSTNFYDNIDFRQGLSFPSFSDSFGQTETITLEEQIAYLTIPIDFTYKVWEHSNWGLDVIGGVDISLLGKNKVIAKSKNRPAVVLGSNKNYLENHFGIHVGGGLFYNLNKTFQVRLESLFEPRVNILDKNQNNLPAVLSTKIGVMVKF